MDIFFVKLLFAALTELMLVIAIASSDWLRCKFNEPRNIGLWTSVEKYGIVMMVCLRPIVMLWLVSTSVVLIGYLSMCARRSSSAWAEQAVRMALASEGALIIACLAASFSYFPLLSFPCKPKLGFGMVYAASAFYLFHVVTEIILVARTVGCPRQHQNGDDNGETENQGTNETENQQTEATSV
ncbi:uncharacterized protein [Oscarella lobularis]|uniref:uncharacterized protein n=1 Tax=Oscarella lobularis TaxID=121494 RepID=UPI003313B978